MSSRRPVSRELRLRGAAPARSAEHAARASENAVRTGEAAAETGSRPAGRAARAAASKVFVLDTNVLMHDPVSLFRFEEHDVYLPMQTLEELDRNKKGTSEVARNARQASRFIEEVMSRSNAPIERGIPLKRYPSDSASGNLLLQTEAIEGTIPANLPSGNGDNLIIGVVAFLQKRWRGREVILVSKDINMRIKARAAGLRAEDYFNDKVPEDTELLYSGVR